MYFRGDVAHIDGPGGHGAPSPLGFVTCLTTTAAAGSRGPGSRRRTRLVSPGGYLVMPLSLSQAAAASLAFCFWLPLTARFRLIRSSVVRVLETLFSASLA